MNQSKSGIPEMPPNPPTVLPDAARREGERSEPDRSAAPGNTVAPPPPPRPNPEVVVDARRRSFTAEYKRRILAETAAASAVGAGAVGIILRREGLYSSHLAAWRKEREAAILQGLSHKRGPLPARNPLQDEVERLTRENLRLGEDLRKASIMIDFPKKVATLWDLPTPSPRPENRP